MSDGVGILLKCDGFITEQLWMHPGDELSASVDCDRITVEVNDIQTGDVPETTEGLDKEPADEAYEALKSARYYWGQPAGPVTVGSVERARDLLDEALPEEYQYE